MKKYVRNFRPAGFQKGDLNPSRKPERRKAISEWRKKQKLSGETKRRISISMKKALQSPELREKWRQKALGRKLSPETKIKIVATRRKNHPPSIKRLTQKLDEIYSQYIRLSNMNEQGYIKCFTCGKFFPYAGIDCGHYISRTYKTTRWMEENTQPQCRKCNRFLEGVKDVFALNLQKKYGIDILQWLNDKKNEIKKFNISDLEELTAYFKEKIQEAKDGS